MIATLHRGPVRRLVFQCVWRTQRASDRGVEHSQGAHTVQNGGCTTADQAPMSSINTILMGSSTVFFFFFFLHLLDEK
ncbi:unnamed protein product, partial [Staurois parvus]